MAKSFFPHPPQGERSSPQRGHRRAWRLTCPSRGPLAAVMAAGLATVVACFVSGRAGAARDAGSADANADRADAEASVPETAAASVPATAPVEPEPTVAETVWQTEYEQALALAAEQGRPLLLRFTAEWCVPCQVMERSVFPDRDVTPALAGHAVPEKIDIDDERNAHIARRYGIRGIPTLLLVDPNGDKLDRGGFMSAEARRLERPHRKHVM